MILLWIFSHFFLFSLFYLLSASNIVNTVSDTPIGIRASRPSSAAAKIRSAIDKSHKYNTDVKTIKVDSDQSKNQEKSPGKDIITENDIKNIEIIGNNVEIELGLDETNVDNLISKKTTVYENSDLSVLKNNNKNNNNGDEVKFNDEDEDEEAGYDMDGKRFSLSNIQLHPEISTASPSVEFGLLSIGLSSPTIQSYTGSIDSLQEEQIGVGLSTVPNQFCSSREAIELNKLLILSKG